MKFRAPANSSQAVYQAGSFYTRVFGWDFSPFQGPEDFWPITQELLSEWEAAAHPGTPPIGSPTENIENDAAPLQAIAVISLEEAGQRIVNEGGKVLTAPVLVAGVGYLIYCQDASGNPFAMLEASGGPIDSGDSSDAASGVESADAVDEGPGDGASL